MLEESARLIAQRVGDDARVLDVGGGARPFSRADCVLDAIAYESRGELGYNGDPAQERFDAASWVQRDICDREPWPFADREFDFAVCSHTLEDVRDPVYVAAELQRVAAAGYIEVPAVREELTYGIQGPWVGWGHHRWLVFVGESGLEFVFKHHVVNRPDSHLPAGSQVGVPEAERVQTLWWHGGFQARERLIWTAAELDELLRRLAAPQAGAPAGGPAPAGWRGRIARLARR